MATDTAPRPRRMYWQLPVFAVGVAAALLAWRTFPLPSAAGTGQIAQDRYTLRQTLQRRPVNVAEVQSLLASLGDEGTKPGGDSEVAFVLGSAFVLLAEQGPPEQGVDHWKRAHALFAECDGTKLADKNDRGRLTFRAAKAAAGAGVGDPAGLLPQLNTVPFGEEPGERSRLMAETLLRLTPPNTKEAKKELAGYLSGPPRGTPEQAARLKLTLADLCATTGEPDKARTWLKEIGDPVPSVLQAEAKVRLARMATADNDVNEAVKLFQAAEALPDLPPAVQAVVRYETGRGLAHLGNLPAAKEYLAKAAESRSPAGTAATVRLAELDPAAGLAHLEAALTGLKSPADWTNPHLPLAELRGVCEAVIGANKSGGQFPQAVKAAELYAAVADPGRDREQWADVMAAWGSSPGIPDAAEKLKAAAAEYAKLADSRTDAAKTAMLQKAASAYQNAGDTVAATNVLAKLSTPGTATPDVQAAAHLQRAETLLAENKIDDGVKLLGEVANTAGPVGTKATLRLALVYAAEGKKAMAAAPTDPAGAKQVEYAAQLLTQISNQTYTSADERLCHQKALFELGRLQLNSKLPGVFNCSDAETRFRRLTTEYPTGPHAEWGTLFHGIALSQIAQGDGGKPPPADAPAKFTEAKKLFESLAAAKDTTVRTQSEFRLVHTLLHMKDFDGTVEVGSKLAQKYTGEVEELILRNLVFSARNLSKRPDLAQEELGRMRTAFAALPDEKFTGRMEEYTKAYWVRELGLQKSK